MWCDRCSVVSFMFRKVLHRIHITKTRYNSSLMQWGHILRREHLTEGMWLRFFSLTTFIQAYNLQRIVIIVSFMCVVNVCYCSELSSLPIDYWFLSKGFNGIHREVAFYGRRITTVKRFTRRYNYSMPLTP